MVANQAAEGVANVYSHSVSFFDVLLDFFADEVSDLGDYSQRVRLTKAVRNRTGWSQVELAGDNFVKSLQALAKSLDTLFRALNEVGEVMADFEMLAGD